MRFHALRSYKNNTHRSDDRIRRCIFLLRNVQKVLKMKGKQMNCYSEQKNAFNFLTKKTEDADFQRQIVVIFKRFEKWMLAEFRSFCSTDIANITCVFDFRYCFATEWHERERESWTWKIIVPFAKTTVTLIGIECVLRILACQNRKKVIINEHTQRSFVEFCRDHMSYGNAKTNTLNFCQLWIWQANTWTRNTVEAGTSKWTQYTEHLPLFPTPWAPMTAIFTSDNEDFFRRIPLVVIVVAC